MIRPQRRFDPLAVACVVFVSALVAIFAILVREESREVASPGEELIASPPSSPGYRKQTASIVGNFLKVRAALPSTNDGNADLLSSLAAARRDLLALSVPSAERDLHLRLVGAVTEWEEGIQKDDQTLIGSGSGLFFQLLDEFPWLGEGLINQ